MSVSAAVAGSCRRTVIFMGIVFALGSLGIDSILPSLGVIAHDLQLDHPDLAQLLVTCFAAGMGLGSLFGGPLSDQHGRRPVMLAGCWLYVAGSLSVLGADSLAMILIARLVQGIGASLTTVATTAWVRDQHAGVKMARIMSFAMTLFAMMPAVAPFMGKYVAAVAGWRAIFALYALVAGGLSCYVLAAVPETFAGPRVRFTPGSMLAGAKRVLSVKQTRLAIAGQTLNMAVLFSLLSTLQSIFDRTFHRAGSFPGYFAMMAIAIACAGFLNGKMVSRVGSQSLVLVAFALNTLLSLLLLCGGEPVWGDFPWFVLWATGAFFTQGLTTGNLGALALEPVGDVAGMASSLVSAIPMLLAAPLAMLTGLLSSSGPRPLVLAILVFSALGCFTVRAVMSPETLLET